MDRVERQTKQVEKAYENQKRENALLIKRLELLEKALQGQTGPLRDSSSTSLNSQTSNVASQSPQSHEAQGPLESVMRAHPDPRSSQTESEQAGKQNHLYGQDNLKSIEAGHTTTPLASSTAFDKPVIGQFGAVSQPVVPVKSRPTAIEMRIPRRIKHNTVDTRLPQTTYAKGILLAGVIASTATNSQSDSRPIFLRLVDPGNLPRGWKSKVRDAHLVGSCYGDLSSERAYCRLESMTWVEADGTIIERSVEGWVMGEDGSVGLRGRVIDRAQDTAQQAFVAGILSGMSNFLQQQAQGSVFPISPFGQTNRLDGQNLAFGTVGKGAGSALEKLADFAIRRMELMSPVIAINGGRVVDVVFRKGFSLQDQEEPGYQSIESTQQNQTNQQSSPQTSTIQHSGAM